MPSRHYIASDYAGISGGQVEFYYGYERTDENEEWCFTAKANGKEIMRIPTSKISPRQDCADMGEYLLAGIARWIDAGCPMEAT